MGQIGKKLSAGLCLWAFLLTFAAYGQGTLVYDQQTIGSVEGSVGVVPLNGQSFTPTLSSVGFFQLRIFDATGIGNGGGQCI